MQNRISSDPLAGLDLKKLKQNVIALWRRGGGDTLVEVRCSPDSAFRVATTACRLI
jgi:hypothetical protein